MNMNTTTSCKADEISVMTGSNSHRGVRRTRDTETTTTTNKIRRLDINKHENMGVQNESPSNYEDEVCSGDHVVSSTCLKHDSNLDLKTELFFKTETFMSSNDGFRETSSSSSEICLDSDEMESSSILKTNPLPRSTTTTAAEIEEFFSVVEKNQQKRFADKYNYDIVNDVPMEGRYKWVLLKP